MRCPPRYLAIVVRGGDGERLGYLGVMSSHELDAGEEAIAVPGIFASRAGAEIERRRHEAVLRAREREVAVSAHASCRSPTRSAAASAATCTTARSSG